MKVGIMQPYFLPYLGYWQLFNAVDIYVIADDFNYIKNGWINRNNIIINGQPNNITIPIKKASSRKLICDSYLADDKSYIQKNIDKIRCAYKKAPYFKDVFPLVERIFNSEKETIAQLNVYAMRVIAQYLDIDTKIVLSSELEQNRELKAQDRVIDIVKSVGGDTYYNAIGGQQLYSFDVFKANGIQLAFVETMEISYDQLSDNFYPNLSILDILMCNSVEEVKGYLNKFKLIEK